MAFRLAYRCLCRPVSASLIPCSSSYTSYSVLSPRYSSTYLLGLRHLVAATDLPALHDAVGLRSLSTHQTTSSLNDPNPNWSNRPPKETILLDGCDFEHWLVVMEKAPEEWTRDQIIDYYIKTLASIVGSEEEARMKIYSVSTRCYFAFGALVSEELSYKIKELPKVRWVLPDSYLDVKNKNYGGEPFINGQAVAYDPKYHEEWIRNNSQAMMRNERNKRRGFDRRNRRDIPSQASGSSMPYRDGAVHSMAGAQQPDGNTSSSSVSGLGGSGSGSAMQSNTPPGSAMQFNARPSSVGNSGFAHPGGLPNVGGIQQPNGVGSAGRGWGPQSNAMDPAGLVNQTTHSAGMGWSSQSHMAGVPPQGNTTGDAYNPAAPQSQFNERWPASSMNNDRGEVPLPNTPWPPNGAGNAPNRVDHMDGEPDVGQHQSGYVPYRGQRHE